MTKYRFSLASVAILLLLNLVLFSCSLENTTNLSAQEEKLEPTSIEEIMAIPTDQVTCITGGEGQSSCKIKAGVKIGDHVSISCGVGCREGYYACCGERCVCKPERK